MKALDAALSPVREALLTQSRADGDGIREQSEADAREAATAATAEADRIRAAARAEGEAQASAEVAAALSQARTEARAVVLAARLESYLRLRSAARDAVAGMGAEAEVRQRLVAAIRATLGPKALIVDLPDGGMVGVTTGRRIDLSLTGFADREVDAQIGHEAEEES